MLVNGVASIEFPKLSEKLTVFFKIKTSHFSTNSDALDKYPPVIVLTKVINHSLGIGDDKALI